jgi:hypothetical protein
MVANYRVLLGSASGTGTKLVAGQMLTDASAKAAPSTTSPNPQTPDKESAPADPESSE